MKKTESPVCGAKTRSGQPCRRSPVVGRKRCRLHGGLTLRGPDSPAWKHGRYSSTVPKYLRDKVETAERDPQLMSLHEEIVLVQALISSTLERGGLLTRWPEIEQAARRVEFARVSGNEREAKEHTERLLALILEPAEDGGDAFEKKIVELAESKAKLVEKEYKRLVEMNQVITAERAFALVAAIVSVVREVVKDRAQLITISQRLGVVLGRSIDRPGTTPGGGVAGV